MKEVPDFTEQKSYHIDNLMLAYIKLWGIVEAYSKIIYRLYEKRTNLKELEPLLNEVKRHKENLIKWEQSVSILIGQYTENISTGTVAITADNIKKEAINLKAIKVTKYSVEKRDISLMKLPSKEDFEKACVFLGVGQKNISSVLKPKNGESVFYKTRNSIAHEGKSDIVLKNFILIRIDPVKEVVSEIILHANKT
ncbi:MAG: hypothetical protein RPU13_13480 [Candidatus Sedimenticola sp. (ex Thyasira tokunagai)]